MDGKMMQQQEHTSEERMQGLVATGAAAAQGTPVQEKPLKPYKLRRLQAKDISPMAKIIGKIGIDELISCWGDDDLTELMVKLKKRKSIVRQAAEAAAQEDGNVIQSADAGSGGKDNSEFIVGVAVATRIANQVLQRLDRCEKEVYGLLGSLSGMSAAEVAELELEVFIQMLVDIVRENNVVNFIRAAIKLL
ncbi:MAG: hypothetical protein NC517_09010 [Firmicutes bacterium]|nr:hypothetical protein [Bacillota bacterium]